MMNDILHQDYQQPHENLTKKQKNALKSILAKEEHIKKIQDEIAQILKDHDLNGLDIDRFKHDQNIEKFLKMKIPE